ncbi:MAG TPA: RodZ domain-containing protein [Solirubrobacteraceae bacterium]|jgi:cytoskeletal protein RodZ|nr:RodZ domain-containing protein [Solirubrobacteraceae bacterium]
MADIGTTLREARIRARIDMSEVEARTKIRAKYLRAIENEEWDLLPGPVYVKSFLRTYGDFLGLDSRTLVDEYKRQYERPSDNELRPISTLSRERERAARGPRIPPWVLVGVVLVAIVVALYFVGSNNNNNSSSNSPNTPNTTAAQQPSQHRKTHKKKQHKTAPAKPKTVTLQLVPTATVYVCVENGAGTTLIAGRTFAAGETVPTEKAAKLLITLGNSSVQMKVNGKAVQVAQGSPIGYSITPSAMTPLPSGQQPTCT